MNGSNHNVLIMFLSGRVQMLMMSLYCPCFHQSVFDQKRSIEHILKSLLVYIHTNIKTYHVYTNINKL